ncbi:hypothetical protein JCM8547_005622 [Rhodosporidiobolus lusitaniae]
MNGGALDDDYEFPFQLPLSRSSSSLSLSSSNPPSTSTLPRPSSPAGPPTQPVHHPVPRSSSLLGVYPPNMRESTARRRRPPPAPDSSTPAALALQQQGAGSGGEPVAVPPARSSRTTSLSSTAPGGVESPAEGNYGTRSAGATRTGAPATQPPPAPAPSLKIVLKRSRAGSSTASPDSAPPVITLDSRSPSPSRTTLSPALPPPSAPPTASTSTLPPPSSILANVKKGQKNGRDGLNRVCHHHKSQTDRPRMTCINAPECRTVWCNVCVEKHYLHYTPLNLFEPSGVFSCPVCLDVCACAGCKRKRRNGGSNRRASVSTVASAVGALEVDGGADEVLVVDGARDAGGEGGEGGEKKKKKKKRDKDGKRIRETGEKKKKKKDRKGKSRATEEDVSMLSGMEPLEAAAMGLGVGMGLGIVEGEEEGADPAGGDAESASEGEEDAADVQRMLVEGNEEDEELPPLEADPAPRPTSLTLHLSYPSPSASASASPDPLAYDPSAPVPAAPPSGRRPPPPRKKGKKSRKSNSWTVPKRPRPSGGSSGGGGGGGSRNRTRAPPATVDPYSAPDSTFNHGHALPPYHSSVFGTASSSYFAAPPAEPEPAARPKRNKRPSTAFEDYAVGDFAPASALVFNERVGQNASSSNTSRRTSYQSSWGLTSAAPPPPPPYPSREEIAAQQQQSKRQRRYRASGISSASSCDGLSSAGETVDDMEEELEDDGAGGSLRPEEPLPVLAGLERNLGLEPPAEGEEGDNQGEMFGMEVGVVPLASPVLSLDLETGGGGEEIKPRVVKWIEGPERRKRRAEKAAREAAAAKEAQGQEGKEKAASAPPPPLAPSAAAPQVEEVKPRPASMGAKFPVGGSSTSACPSSPALAAVKQEPLDDPSPPHISPGVVPPSPNATLFPFPSPASPTQASAAASLPALSSLPVPSSNPPGPPSSAPPTLPLRADSVDTPPSAASRAASLPVPSASTGAADVQDYGDRSAEDAKLAFALLDAVRAAAGTGPNRPQSNTSESEGAYEIALVSAIASSDAVLGSPARPSRQSHSHFAASRSPLPLSLPPSQQHHSRSHSPSSSDLPPPIEISDLSAHLLEAERRSALLAASTSVDPGKAFKRFKKREEAEAQFFVKSAYEDDVGERMDLDLELDEEDGDVGPSASVRGGGRETSSSVPPQGGGGFDFDPFVVGGADGQSPLLVEDLWTPTSVAETSLSLSTSASTAPSSIGGGGGGGAGTCGERELLDLAAVARDGMMRRPKEEEPGFARLGEGGGELEFAKEMEIELGGVMGWMEEMEGAGEGWGEGEGSGVEAF